jgi:hypothetical protein
MFYLCGLYLFIAYFKVKQKFKLLQLKMKFKGKTMYLGIEIQ